MKNQLSASDQFSTNWGEKENPVRYSAGLHDPIFICTFTTVKPLYSGHHWDLKIVSVIERCSLHRGSS